MTTIIKQTLLAILFAGAIFAQNTNVLDVRDNNRVFRVLDNASNDLDLTDYTIEFWVYSDTSIAYRNIIQRKLSTSSDDLWEIKQTAGTGGTMKIQLHINHGGTDFYAAIDTVSLNEWHFISYTYVDSLPRLIYHLDGKQISSRGSTDYALPASDDTLFFFGTNPTGYSSFDGVIDEIRISNTARYGWGDYSVSKTDSPFTDDTNTVLLYHFDDTATPPTSSASNFSFTHLNGVDASGTRGIQSGDYVAASSIGGGLPLPVELTSFNANVSGGVVTLTWETATEVNNYGFSVESKDVSGDWKEIGFVDGAGNSNLPQQYSFVDTRKVLGEVSYRLKQIDFNGKYEYSDVITVESENKLQYKLAQNTPNPFNPSTTISFTMPKAGNVKLNIYNSLGQLVQTLVNSNLEAGTHKYQFNANNLSSGIYFYTISVNGFTAVRKMNLLK